MHGRRADEKSQVAAKARSAAAGCVAGRNGGQHEKAGADADADAETSGQSASAGLKPGDFVNPEHFPTTSALGTLRNRKQVQQKTQQMAAPADNATCASATRTTEPIATSTSVGALNETNDHVR